MSALYSAEDEKVEDEEEMGEHFNLYIHSACTLKNVRVILKLLWLSELHLFGVPHDCSAFAVLDHQFWKQNVAIRISMSSLYTAIMRV